MIEGLGYIVSFAIANGATSFVLSKMSEKKIIAKFDDVKTTRTNKVEKYPVVPEKIKDIVEVIEKNVDKENLNNLYTNLSNVKIRKRFLLILLGLKGRYNSEKNTLEYSLKDSLEHEVFHLASAHYDESDNICQSGFVHYGEDFVLCKALNEGYTDLMARRLFNKRASFYDEEVRIVQFFELLFNKKELEKYYFTNDLVSFVNKLSTLIGREEAIKMLVKFDLGHELKKQGNPAYKIIYTELKLKLSEIFMNSKKPINKQVDHLLLLDESPITDTIIKMKKLQIPKLDII